MSALAKIDFYEEHAWLLGDTANAPCLTEGARRLREIRIDAFIFKRRARLMFHWRRQTLVRAQEQRRAATIDLPCRQRQATADGDIDVIIDLPRSLPVLRDEIAILRAFLAREIDAILFER